MKSIFLPLAGVASLLVVGQLAVRRAMAPAPRPVLLLTGIDTSRSVRVPLAGGGTQLGRSLAQLAEVGASLAPGTDQIVAFRVDNTTQEFISEGAPDDEDQFTWTLIARTKVAPAQDGTFPAPFWVEAASRAASATTPVAVALWSDGDDDSKNLGQAIQIRRAALALAANKRVVSVDVFGVTPKNWDALRDLFAPLGNRLHLHVPETIDTEGLLQRLEAARPPTSANS